MKVLITGAGGQLGREMANCHGGVALGRRELDVADLEAVRRICHREQPEVVLNAAAMTGVDECEENPDAAYRVNALGPRNLACVAREIGACLVHVSTDYVFNGEKGGAYTEFDLPDPINVYGRSKLAGEAYVRELAPRHLIIRTAWLYSALGSRDFVRTVRGLLAEGGELKVVDDQHGSPTYVPDLAQAILELVRVKAAGTYHLAGTGACSRFAFAQAVAQLSGYDQERIRPVSTRAFPPRPARRPRGTPLRGYLGELEGRAPLRNWEEALGECLASKG